MMVEKIRVVVTRLWGVARDRRMLLLWCLGAAACGGGGGGSLPAGPTPTPRPTPAPAAAVELASGVAVSTVAGFTAALGQTTSNPIGGASDTAPQFVAPRTMMAHAALLAGMTVAPEREPAVVSGCPHGGTINASCTSNATSTTVTATLSNCGLTVPDSADTLTASGGLTATLQAPGLCGVATLPDVMFTAQFTNFSGIRTDPSGTVIERASGTFTEVITPTGTGCAGSNSTGSVNGTLNDEIDAAGINVALVAHNFAFTQSSSGTPCVQQVTANGGLDINDLAATRRFSPSFADLRVTLLITGEQLMQATIDGPRNTDCVGNAQFQTLTPLQFPSRSECPSAGQLAVTREGNTNGRITFMSNGIGFDFNADGVIDATVASCEDAMQCPG